MISAPAAPTPAQHVSDRTRVWGAAGLYLVLALFATWPLARGLAKDVPWDLGDPLLNMWILSWDCEQFRAILGGDIGRIAHLFDGNIFHPAALTLAYSEHLIPQALQIFPIYLATRDPILCYNLLFLSTYVLSGVGAYLLVRELTGDWRAALFGGLLFALAPYRIPQSAHLQVLSSQWMAFALYGVARYFNTGRRRALAGGAVALALQNLSCGYFLLYFGPFAAAYVVWEVSRRGLWHDRTVLIDVAGAGMLAGALTAPFLLPYVRVQQMMPATRPLAEVIRYSADVYSYVTALEVQSIWGPILQIYRKDEGELFPGAVACLLSLLAIAIWGVRAWKAGRLTPAGPKGITAVLGAIAAGSLGLVLAVIFTRRLALDLGPVTLRVNSVGRTLIWLVVAGAALLAVSPRARVRLRALGTADGFFYAGIVATWWLSLGPRPRAFGRPLDIPSPYAWLYDTVPGFDGVRVPARLAMVLALMLAVAGGMAVTALLRRRWGPPLVAILGLLFVAEAHARPFGLNGQGSGKGHVLPEARIYRPARAPIIYQRVAALPRGTVLLEMPVGDPNWDLRSVYYSTVHWHPVLNGYSGFFPPSYGAVIASLNDPDRTPREGWQVMRTFGATHVLVHRIAFRLPEVEQIDRWLIRGGAKEVARSGTDVLYALPAAPVTPSSRAIP